MPDQRSIYWEPEWEPARGCDGTDVPHVTGDEFVQAMRENVSEAIKKRDQARVNLHRLKVEGKIVEDVREGRWRPVAVKGPRGTMIPHPEADVAFSDWFRAVSELAHWQEYLEWAKIQRGAEAVADPRLPPEPEPDDGEVPF